MLDSKRKKKTKKSKPCRDLKKILPMYENPFKGLGSSSRGRAITLCGTKIGVIVFSYTVSTISFQLR